jgi:hypothetical protein
MHTIPVPLVFHRKISFGDLELVPEVQSLLLEFGDRYFASEHHS